MALDAPAPMDVPSYLAREKAQQVTVCASAGKFDLSHKREIDGKTVESFSIADPVGKNPNRMILEVTREAGKAIRIKVWRVIDNSTVSFVDDGADGSLNSGQDDQGAFQILATPDNAGSGGRILAPGSPEMAAKQKKFVEALTALQKQSNCN